QVRSICRRLQVRLDGVFFLFLTLPTSVDDGGGLPCPNRHEFHRHRIRHDLRQRAHYHLRLPLDPRTVAVILAQPEPASFSAVFGCHSRRSTLPPLCCCRAHC
ncbi:unnamed protein product, partial [Ectocarpus sp. 6 AP-2014]